MSALRGLAVAACLVMASPALADSYVAISNTAMSITGDIEFDDFEMVFANGEYLEFSDLVADSFIVDGQRVPASVYKVSEPDDPVLENGNQLCGNGDVTYVASWGSDDLTVVAVFTGGRAPQRSDQMCASYTYEIAQ